METIDVATVQIDKKKDKTHKEEAEKDAKAKESKLQIEKQKEITQRERPEKKTAFKNLEPERDEDDNKRLAAINKKIQVKPQ